ncbi:hypothetical protein BN946_scf184801.g28 [Trametes cinnabarina]|uniref:Uncharacterized protein n=1 Tax=Pycnoporus cinnabarinus TaxID=5643 RepID=A0A060S929_PYCCI|nr:hypothetical protein BN946_scf184801.g28 [Trametes cinnabarina]
MKVIFALAAFVASAVAQSVVIASPPPFSTLYPGQAFVVDIDRTPSLTGSDDVAIAIGIQSCAQAGCPSGTSTGDIGTPLYQGLYNPQPVGNGHSDLAQNFTVTVPTFLHSGPALLSVAHFGLIIGVEPFLEVVNQTIIIG